MVLSLMGYKVTVVGGGGTIAGTVAVVLPVLPAADAVSKDEPGATPVAMPAALMVTAPGVPDVQASPASVVMFCWEPSEYVPIAVICSCAPAAMVGVAGSTTMELSTGTVTVNVLLAEMLPDLAVSVVTPAARTLMPCVSLTVATEVLLDVQVTVV